MSANFYIDGNHLRALLRVAGKSDVRYYLNAVYFDPRGYAVATNGHAMLAIKLPQVAGCNAGLLIKREQIELALRAKSPRYSVMYHANDVTIAGIGVSVADKVIDGKFPDWQRVVPVGDFSGVAGNFNATYAEAMADISRDLRNSRKGDNVIPTWHQRGPDMSALVTFVSDAEVIGVVMPVRVDRDAPLPADAVRAFLAPSTAAKAA